MSEQRTPAYYVIRCYGTGSGMPCEFDGMYLIRYEPEAHDGIGLAEWHPDLERAVRFASISDARDAWLRVPSTRPVRDDGKPNRPLTAYTVGMEPVFV